jgi:hypothetical protein
MPANECNRCGTLLPTKARYCRSCGLPIQKKPGILKRLINATAWTLGSVIWVLSGFVMFCASGEGWTGVAAGASFLFSTLLLTGLVAFGYSATTRFNAKRHEPNLKT